MSWAVNEITVADGGRNHNFIIQGRIFHEIGALMQDGTETPKCFQMYVMESSVKI